MYEIGKNIKSIREQKGISQKDFAAMINSKNTTVSNWEKGLTRPDVDTLSIICKALNVSADLLLGIDDKLNNNTGENLLLSNFNKLNGLGKHEAVKRVEELTYIDKYKKGSKPYEENSYYASAAAEEPAKYSEH